MVTTLPTNQGVFCFFLCYLIYFPAVVYSDFNPQKEPMVRCLSSHDDDLFMAPYLYDSPAQPRHFCQLLQRLRVRVVVLGKLALHHLWGDAQTHTEWVRKVKPLRCFKRRPLEPMAYTCSCSAVKDVRALLAGFGWQSWSEGRAPSRVSPVPFQNRRMMTGFTLVPSFTCRTASV